jgi:uncharacterized protein YyaL (SSP411 family)
MPDQTDPTNPEAAPGVLRVRQREVSNTAAAELEIASLVPQTRTLHSARETRPRPARDEKLLVGWNGLAIDAFVVNGEVFHDPEDIAIAKRAAERIWDLAWDAQKEQLSHQVFLGRAQGSAFLEDYALLGRSFLSLYQATGEKTWLQRARTLADALLRRFDANGNSMLKSTSDGDALIVALVEEGDGPYPAGASAAVEQPRQGSVWNGSAHQRNGAPRARVCDIPLIGELS